MRGNITSLIGDHPHGWQNTCYIKSFTTYGFYRGHSNFSTEVQSMLWLPHLGTDDY